MTSLSIPMYFDDVERDMVVYVAFLRDVACRKLLNSANVSRSYSQ